MLIANGGELTSIVGHVCSLPVAHGTCRAAYPKIFYNSNTGKCEPFVYGGCGGNANRFDTVAQCQQTCSTSAKCCNTGNCADYRGTQATTVSGKTCQSWGSQWPHKHDRTHERYPDAGLVGNLCRNPDGEQSAWCYTTSWGKRWEYCGIPSCRDVTQANCCSTSDCSDYRGLKSTTASGRTCQAWTRQSPHTHTRTPQKYPTSGLVSNFCRNPDGAAFAWCYTTDRNSRFESCGIPICPNLWG